MLARELMTMPVVTLEPGWPVRRAIGVLHRHDITAAPVIDDAGRMVGIVSEMDLLRDAFATDPRATLRASIPAAAPAPRTVAEVMTGRVLSVPENADVSDVVDLMMSTGVKSVPITRGNRLTGVVSRRDRRRRPRRRDHRPVRDRRSPTLNGRPSTIGRPAAMFALSRRGRAGGSRGRSCGSG